MSTNIQKKSTKINIVTCEKYAHFSFVLPLIALIADEDDEKKELTTIDIRQSTNTAKNR